MTRILLLIILFWLLYHVLRRVAASTKPSAPPPAKPDEKIVQCARCSLRVPESESHIHNGQVVCKNPQCNDTTQ